MSTEDPTHGPPPQGPSRYSLLEAAHALCHDFSTKAPLDNLLSHFLPASSTVCIEHGEPSLAPFLGRTYNGPDGAKEYFETLQKLLSFEDMSFDGWVADADEKTVACRGKAKFTWLETGQSWHETFAYRLEFKWQDEEVVGGGEWKVERYEVWADSGAA